MRNPELLQNPGQVFRPLDAGGADENRLAGLVALLDVIGDGQELGLLGLVDQVALVLADHRPVGRDRNHAELVDLVQLGGLGLGSAGHTGQLLVKPVVVLQGDRGQRLALRLDLDTLFGLDGLMDAVVVAATGEHAAAELVDDDDLTVTDQIVLVALVELLGLERVVEVVHQRGVDRLVEVLDTELVLDELHAQFVDTHGALAQVHLVVDVLLHQRGKPGEFLVPVRGVVGRSGDDQRGAGLVDQDRVDLVDDGEVVPALLDQIGQRMRHVIAQVVEAQLPVGAVGDVGVVGRPALFGVELVEDHIDIEAQEAVHPAHPLGVTFGQVLVDGHHVHALAAEPVEVRRQHTGQGFTLTGLHLRHVAEVQGGPTHDLYVEVPLGQHPRGRLPGDGEGLGQQVVEIGAVVDAPLELRGLGPQLFVGQLLDLVGEGIDIVRHTPEALDHATFTEAQQLRQHSFHPLWIGGVIGHHPR